MNNERDPFIIIATLLQPNWLAHEIEFRPSGDGYAAYSFSREFDFMEVSRNLMREAANDNNYHPV